MSRAEGQKGGDGRSLGPLALLVATEQDDRPVIFALSLLTLMIWSGLLLVWGGFWRADQWLASGETEQASWPDVTILVPARDEAAVIGPALESLLAQDYPGTLQVILIDDGSTDGTGDIAGRLAQQDPRLSVMGGAPLPTGWTGKLWALQQGVAAAGDTGSGYFWMSDADIRHAPDILRRLVTKAEREERDLVSVMARLDVTGAWARLLIPAFIYFFQKLYPFAWVNDPRRKMAAAAGGCVLIRRDAFARVGGYAPIADALIDDVALGRLIKQRDDARPGGIWLGFTPGVDSLRPSADLSDIWMMVVRTAFTQLHYSALLLVGTVLGMVLIYLAPPILVSLALIGQVAIDAALMAAAATLLMLISFRPTLRRYGQPFWIALGLPLAGLLYTAMTVDSARRYWQGTGGTWKGRAQASRTTANPRKANPTKLNDKS